MRQTISQQQCSTTLVQGDKQSGGLVGIGSKRDYTASCCPCFFSRRCTRFQLLLLENVAHDLNIPCYNGQRYVALKTTYPVVSATIQAMVFQSVYGRLHRRMLSPSLTKRFSVFDFFVDSRQFPFAGKGLRDLKCLVVVLDSLGCESPCQSCNWSTAGNAPWFL